MSRSPLTETIHRVQGMITYARENLSTDEFMLFLDLLVPEPEPEVKTTAKKSRKKRTSKSPRASALSDTIRSRAQERAATRTPDNDMEYCSTCGAVPDNNVHHKQSDPHYHLFVPPAPLVPNPSSAISAEGVGTVSSGVSAASAGAATGGSSERGA